MRILVIGSGSVLGWILLSYFMEPFFPLGDVRWLIAALLMFGIAAWAWYSDPARKKAVEAALSLNEIPNLDEQSYVTRSPMEIMKLLENLTSIEIESVSSSYRGLRMRVSGTVHNVGGLRRGLMMTLSVDGVLVFPLFAKEWKAKITTLRKGDSVIVDGEIEGVADHGVSLKESRLISAPDQ